MGSPGWEACRKCSLHLFPEWEWSVNWLGWLHVAHYKALYRFSTTNSFQKLSSECYVQWQNAVFLLIFSSYSTGFPTSNHFLHISLTFLVLAWWWRARIQFQKKQNNSKYRISVRSSQRLRANCSSPPQHCHFILPICLPLCFKCQGKGGQQTVSKRWTQSEANTEMTCNATKIHCLRKSHFSIMKCSFSFCFAFTIQNGVNSWIESFGNMISIMNSIQFLSSLIDMQHVKTYTHLHLLLFLLGSSSFTMLLIISSHFHAGQISAVTFDSSSSPTPESGPVSLGTRKAAWYWAQLCWYTMVHQVLLFGRFKLEAGSNKYTESGRHRAQPLSASFTFGRRAVSVYNTHLKAPFTTLRAAWEPNGKQIVEPF